MPHCLVRTRTAVFLFPNVSSLAKLLKLVEAETGIAEKEQRISSDDSWTVPFVPKKFLVLPNYHVCEHALRDASRTGNSRAARFLLGEWRACADVLLAKYPPSRQSNEWWLLTELLVISVAYGHCEKLFARECTALEKGSLDLENALGHQADNFAHFELEQQIWWRRWLMRRRLGRFLASKRREADGW